MQRIVWDVKPSWIKSKHFRLICLTLFSQKTPLTTHAWSTHSVNDSKIKKIQLKGRKQKSKQRQQPTMELTWIAWRLKLHCFELGSGCYVHFPCAWVACMKGRNQLISWFLSLWSHPRNLRDRGKLNILRAKTSTSQRTFKITASSDWNCLPSRLERLQVYLLLDKSWTWEI